MLKIAIIEDEKLTALDLADTLKKIDSEIEIVAILSSLKKATEFLATSPQFDLLFSDIQLPDGLSIDFLKNIKLDVPVIFCTAFDQYALEAFNSHGIDYLLKPFSKESVTKALDKYQKLKEKFSPQENNFNKILQLLGNQMGQSSPTIIIHKGDKIIPIETKDIALFFLEDDYVFAMTFDSKKHIVSQSLEDLELIVGQTFFRANRQFLVNRKAVKDAEKYFNRKIVINLNINFSEQILVGKLKTTLFLKWLANS